MKYGTIGTSWITDAMIEGANYAGCMRLGAVYSRDLARAAAFGAKHGCSAVFDDLHAMAGYDGIGAVYIASPNKLHYEHCKLFLEQGKHVLCEKPLVVSPEEERALRHMAEERGLVFLEAMMMMHHPERDAIKKALSGIGTITTARLDFSQLSSKYPQLKAGGMPNIFNTQLGAGALMDMGCYCFYPAVEWLGMPTEVYAHAGHVHTGADGWLSCLLVYDQEIHANITLSKTGQGFAGSEILGDEGSVVIDFVVELRGVWLRRKGGEQERIIRDYTRTELMAAEAQDFCDYIAGEKRGEYRHMQRVAKEVCALNHWVKERAGV
ncbi:MAG TPA: oxidoreductase [Clostridiales bacterium]|nr:oxidoreductase [Clostridiales bacterium]